ncbi:hypothetical protein AMAG_14241 [Allomyces macrogynus ATCC 38327]|uniref:Probable vacuolar protein sorting-associated protein 16 homolog n=1 Tax=Allomyces macrogynus (strain ATCC 38327) TaxID=578462 RepID=A0A0L0T4M4_ALLM3|nr:hypothetical protein AMAG_14241 [Allomyces macrogynus ATCC 38327]|eukprot:KNE69690.1 hypothetical protein AMAG_14241 [Allomyces macrogynus ATCC 38327]
MATTARDGWIALGESAVCQSVVYDLDWDLRNLDAMHVAQSPTGAFIGVARDDRKPYFTPGGAKSPHFPLCIYSATGQLLRSIPWDREPASILKLGWTDNDQLVAVLDDASVRLYPVYGDPVALSLGEEVAKNGIASARIWPTGLAVLTKSGHFTIIGSWSTPVPRNYLHYVFTEQPASWTHVVASNTISGSVELLVPVANSLVVISEMDHVEKPYSSLQAVQVSPQANFWACVLSSFMLEIRLAQTNQVVARLDLKSIVEGDLNGFQLAWCGEDAVLVAFAESLIIMHMSGQHYAIDLFEPVILTEAHECCFQLTSTELTMFTPVLYATMNVFKIGSTHPGAILMDALAHYSRKSAQSVDLLEGLLKDQQLRIALATCLEAAGQAWDPKLQHQLLQAVQFGRVWMEQDVTLRDEYTATCQRLRVLNAVRNRTIGIPLTALALQRLGYVGLARRLTRARQHLLAYRLAEYLHLAHAKVEIVTDWAKLKITHSQDFDVNVLVATIVARVQASTAAADAALDYSDLAVAAYRAGQPAVATKLLDHERDPAKQVPLLMDMGQPQLALVKALDSFDRDLVHLVLVYLRSHLMLNEFFKTVLACPRSIPYLEQYARDHDRQLLRDFYSVDDRHVERGYLHMENAERAETIEAKLAELREAVTAFSSTRKSAADQKLAEQALDLVHEQAQIAKDHRDAGASTASLELPEGKSLNDTILYLIRTGQTTRVAKLKSKFQVPEKRYAWLMVRGLVAARDWRELERYAAATRKPVIGYLPFARELIAAGAADEAKKYITKWDIKIRIDLFLGIRAYVEAAQVAVQFSAMPGLVEIRKQTPAPADVAVVADLLAQLRRK